MRIATLRHKQHWGCDGHSEPATRIRNGRRSGERGMERGAGEPAGYPGLRPGALAMLAQRGGRG